MTAKGGSVAIRTLVLISLASGASAREAKEPQTRPLNRVSCSASPCARPPYGGTWQLPTPKSTYTHLATSSGYRFDDCVRWYLYTSRRNIFVILVVLLAIPICSEIRSRIPHRR
jgi:hypothetical protein